ncbi:MAG: hypothetical protein ACK56I_28280, partial [bacterium]
MRPHPGGHHIRQLHHRLRTAGDVFQRVKLHAVQNAARGRLRGCGQALHAHEDEHVEHARGSGQVEGGEELAGFHGWRRGDVLTRCSAAMHGFDPARRGIELAHLHGTHAERFAHGGGELQQ